MSVTNDGEECPVCGAPYCPGESGVIELRQVHPDTSDATSWVRVCHGPEPERGGEGHLMMYVHRDEHIDVVGEGGESA